MATSPWYREGTAKFTQGSTTVTGTDTEWVKFVRAGDGIQGPDGKLYQITNVSSNTSLSIVPAYGGNTSYWTIPVQGYVKQLADTAAQIVRDFEGGAQQGSGDSLQKSANLSDLVNPATARNNLGLGTASTRDVTTSNADVTVGRLLKVGDLGSNKHPALTRNFNELPDLYPYSGFVSVMTGLNSLNRPPKGHYYHVLQAHYSSNAGNLTQLAIPYRLGVEGFYIRSRLDGNWTEWKEIYHTGNILKTTGDNAEFPMSQKAVTDELELLTERVDELHNYQNVSRIFGPTDTGGMYDTTLLAPGEVTILPNTIGGGRSNLESVGGSGSAVTVMGSQVLKAASNSSYRTNEPLLPSNTPFTFAASFQVPDNALAALLYQHLTGAKGRVQIWANGELNAAGTSIPHKPGKLTLFIGGAPQQLTSADISPNVPFDVVLTLDGMGEAKFYVNGRLISTRQNMPSILNTYSNIFGAPTAPSSDVLFGRAFVIDRVVTQEELRAIRLWVSQGFASNFTSKRPFIEPDITAESAYSMVLPAYGGRIVSGEGVLYSKNPDTPIPPASTTKVLTCVTASKIAKNLGLGTNSYFRNTDATVQSSDITSGSGNNLLSGDSISLYDLMANTLIPSSNTSATVLARTFGTILLESEGQSSPTPTQSVTRFVAEMNSVAISLGMDGSSFANPHGLHDSSQFITARDLALLGVEAMYHTSITELWGQATYTLKVTRGGVSTLLEIENSNTMADDFDILGGKTGNLEGITSNFLVVSRAPGGNIVCTVVMRCANSAARFTDARAVIDSVNSGYTWPQTQPF